MTSHLLGNTAGPNYFYSSTASSGPRPSHYWVFKITLRHTTLGRTALDEWPARRTDLYLTTHNIHDRHFMPPAGFEPVIPASGRPQTNVLVRAVTGIGTGGGLNRMNKTSNKIPPTLHSYTSSTLEACVRN